MADQLDPEQFAAWREGMEQYTRAQYNAKNETERLKDAQERFGKQLGRSAADLGSSLYKGEKGAGVFGNAVESATTALQMLILAIPGIGLAAKVAAVAIGVLGKAANLAAKQSDALYKTYQDLSRAGAATAGGMTEVFENMQKFGYGIEELDKMTALVKENAVALANFGGTVADGTKQFANAAGEIQRSDVGKSLQMLGKTPDEINRGVALFIKQQQQSGVSSANINKNLADQSAAYIKNLDMLSRLTGKDADSLQAKLDDAMAEDAFNQTIYELRKKGEHDRANELEKAAKMLTGEAQKEFIRGAGGDISAMGKTMMVSAKAVGMVGSASFKAAEYIDAVNEGGVQFRDTMGGLYKLNALGDVAFSAKELSDRQSRYADQTAKQQEEMAKAQQDLNQKGLDPATKAATEMRISQMQARDSLQSFVQLGVKPATEALAILARGTAGGAGMLPGGGGKAPMGGGGGGGGGGGAGGGLSTYEASIGGPSTLRRFGMAIGAVGAGPGGEASLGNLRIKSPEAYSGGETSQQLITAAQAIQEKLGGDLHHFSAFNDSYHRGPNSLHGKGRALDFTITDAKKAAAVADMVRSIPGISNVIDEYAKPSGHATAPHIHAEISAANGAILSGPTSGYRPNLTMHGTEAIVPLNNATNQAMSGMGFGNQDSAGIMGQQLDKLDELVRIMQNQVSVSTKILQAAN